MRREALVTAVGVLALLLLGGAKIAPAGDPSAREILKHADRARGNLGGMVWDIKIASNEEGAEETRGLTVTVKGNNTLARYTSPPNLSDRMVLMVDRNMWFIRAGLKKPVSISPRQKLMGDAANGDIASTNYAEDYDATIAGEETVGGEGCYVLELKAAAKNVTYDRIRYWVAKERLVGVRAEFFTISGKLFKTAEFSYGNRVRAGGREEIPFVSELVIRDAIRKDQVTRLTFGNIHIEEIPDSTFNLNLLMR